MACQWRARANASIRTSFKKAACRRRFCQFIGRIVHRIFWLYVLQDAQHHLPHIPCSSFHRNRSVSLNREIPDQRFPLSGSRNPGGDSLHYCHHIIFISHDGNRLPAARAIFHLYFNSTNHLLHNRNWKCSIYRFDIREISCHFHCISSNDTLPLLFQSRHAIHTLDGNWYYRMEDLPLATVTQFHTAREFTTQCKCIWVVAMCQVQQNKCKYSHWHGRVIRFLQLLQLIAHKAIDSKPAQGYSKTARRSAVRLTNGRHDSFCSGMCSAATTRSHHCRYTTRRACQTAQNGR